MAMSIGRVSLLTATFGLVDSTIARVAPPAACAHTPATTPRVSAATVETAGTCRPVTSYNAYDGTPRCAVHECGCRQAARPAYVLAEDVHVADARQARRHVLAGSHLQDAVPAQKLHLYRLSNVAVCKARADARQGTDGQRTDARMPVSVPQRARRARPKHVRQVVLSHFIPALPQLAIFIQPPVQPHTALQGCSTRRTATTLTPCGVPCEHTAVRGERERMASAAGHAGDAFVTQPVRYNVLGECHVICVTHPCRGKHEQYPCGEAPPGGRSVQHAECVAYRAGHTCSSRT